MNAAGIDVSKGKSMVAVYRPYNEMAAQPRDGRGADAALHGLGEGSDLRYAEEGVQ